MCIEQAPENERELTREWNKGFREGEKKGYRAGVEALRKAFTERVNGMWNDGDWFYIDVCEEEAARLLEEP